VRLAGQPGRVRRACPTRPGDAPLRVRVLPRVRNRDYPIAELLLGEPGVAVLTVGSLLMVYGADGSGKSTWTIDGIVHLAAGAAWLGIPVPRPVRICIVENEGPPSLFQQKLAAKITSWDGADPTVNLYVFAAPWGEFSFAGAAARDALNEFCDEHSIDLVTANPTLGLGVAVSGRPDETQQFVDWLVECGLKSNRAFWLLHHETKLARSRATGAANGDDAGVGADHRQSPELEAVDRDPVVGACSRSRRVDPLAARAHVLGLEHLGLAADELGPVAQVGAEARLVERKVAPVGQDRPSLPLIRPHARISETGSIRVHRSALEPKEER
jgi:hypothetical protein